MKQRSISRLVYVANYPVTRNGDEYSVAPFAARLLYHPAELFPEATYVLPESQSAAAVADWKRLNESSGTSVTILPAPRNRAARWLRQWPVLWRSIGEADIVCTSTPDEIGFLTALVCSLRGKPLLLQVIGNWGEAVRFSQPATTGRRGLIEIANFMERWCIRSADLVFAQGLALLQKCQLINPKAARSGIVTSTLTGDSFFRREDAGMRDPVRLLSVSRLERGKGIHVLLEAVEQLSARGIKVELCSVGTGPERGALEAQTAQLGISGRVRFAGNVPFGDELDALYRDADIFVLPSFHEGLPYVILEAMALSLPIVSTTVGGIPYAIRNGTEGILVSPGDAPALAYAIERLANDREEARRLGQAAFARAREYRLSEFAETHRALIEEAFGPIEPVSRAAAPPETSRAKKAMECARP
jgi:glycosyltransferase involved in cell wall biosynthesis